MQSLDLADVMKELVALGAAAMPEAAAIERAFVARATARSPLAYRQDGVVLAFHGDIASMGIWEDGRGWGAYAELAVAKGSLTELESVVGPTTPVPRNPGDFHSGERRAAYVARAGKTIRVFAELDKQDQAQVRGVTVHFQR